MNSNVLNTVNKFKMIKNADNVIVALSGGADSVCLLHYLLSIKEKFNLALYAAHVNHNLRADESLRDEKFVKQLCSEWNIELFIKSIDINQISKKNKLSTEECGRQERYSFFEELSKKLNAKIATAHTASDNAETVIFNIARGCSLKGLCGIPPVRNNIIRPLIEITRTQVEQYCKTNNLQYVNDSTNFEDEYNRNKIRHNVIPVLKQINPAFETTFMGFNSNVKEIWQFLDDYTKEQLKKCTCKDGYYCDMLIKLPNVVLSNAIVQICKKSNVPSLQKKHVELCIKAIQKGESVQLPGNFCAVAVQNIFRLIEKTVDITDFSPVTFNYESKICYNNKKYEFDRISMPDNLKDITNIIDENSINKTTQIRTRKSGDVFELPKRNVTKSLKKLLIELKIPREKRNSLLLIANKNEVLWIEGVGTSKSAQINKNTVNAVKIDIQQI